MGLLWVDHGTSLVASLISRSQDEVVKLLVNLELVMHISANCH
jgi:hypothetical protein